MSNEPGWDSISEDLKKIAAVLRAHKPTLAANVDDAEKRKELLSRLTLFAEELDDVRYRLDIAKDKFQ